MESRRIATEKNHKKPYEKPRLNKVNLDGKCSVLGFCKSTSHRGPANAQCGLPIPNCKSLGS
jgi:hypothetical protein